jgi:hypothetical protein
LLRKQQEARDTVRLGAPGLLVVASCLVDEVIDQISTAEHNRHADQKRYDKHRHVILLFFLVPR